MPTSTFITFQPLVILYTLSFFFNDTATTEIYTLSLHDALPISRCPAMPNDAPPGGHAPRRVRSEEHTSELQSRGHLVCRLLLEKKNKTESWSVVLQEKTKTTDDMLKVDYV